jgi:hypothetical protein
MELENLKFRTKMGRDIYLMNGGILGRKVGTNESVKEFLSKPKSKEIISLLNKGKSTRDISSRLEVSLNLVVKVRKYYKGDKNVAKVSVAESPSHAPKPAKPPKKKS